MATVNYIEYRVIDGKLMRKGRCNAEHIPESDPGNLVIQMKATSRHQKVVCDGYDEKGTPIRPRLVDAPYERHKGDEPGPDRIPMQATQADWQALQKRVKALEGRT